jgi:hypothetical protein
VKRDRGIEVLLDRPVFSTILNTKATSASGFGLGRFGRSASGDVDSSLPKSMNIESTARSRPFGRTDGSVTISISRRQRWRRPSCNPSPRVPSYCEKRRFDLRTIRCRQLSLMKNGKF